MIMMTTDTNNMASIVVFACMVSWVVIIVRKPTNSQVNSSIHTQLIRLVLTASTSLFKVRTFKSKLKDVHKVEVIVRSGYQ